MKMAKRLFLLIFLLIGISACMTPGIRRVTQQGELVVGTAANMPPLNMTTKDGKIIGYEIDIAKLMASALASRFPG